MLHWPVQDDRWSYLPFCCPPSASRRWWTLAGADRRQEPPQQQGRPPSLLRRRHLLLGGRGLASLKRGQKQCHSMLHGGAKIGRWPHLPLRHAGGMRKMSLSVARDVVSICLLYTSDAADDL